MYESENHDVGVLSSLTLIVESCGPSGVAGVNGVIYKQSSRCGIFSTGKIS